MQLIFTRGLLNYPVENSSRHSLFNPLLINHHAYAFNSGKNEIELK